MLKIRDMSFAYGDRVWRVSFSVARGEIVQLIGESGSGKTTVLQGIAGFQALCGGAIEIEGRSVGALPSRERPTASLFQHRVLFPHLTLYENVALACDEKKLRSLDVPSLDVQSEVEGALSTMGLSALQARYPDEVSGGQAQLTALARLWLQKDSRVLLLDEPFSALDPGRRLEILERLRFLVRRQNRCAIITTHAPQEASSFTDRSLFLANEQICFEGSFEDLYALRGRDPFKRYFCARRFLKDGRARSPRRAPS